ncbi:hypothetical protein LOK49_Contig6G00011 [Camellia lanceoleosa]|nr:hypothetical protein LOK49_Contig6G00011 [Camellia lanceoleosa]
MFIGSDLERALCRRSVSRLLRRGLDLKVAGSAVWLISFYSGCCCDGCAGLWVCLLISCLWSALAALWLGLWRSAVSCTRMASLLCPVFVLLWALWYSEHVSHRLLVVCYALCWSVGLSTDLLFMDGFFALGVLPLPFCLSFTQTAGYKTTAELVS